MNSGSSIWAGAELKNIEGARTGYDVSLYLSRDTLFSADDIFLDSIHRTNHQLSGGDQTYVNIQAEIPAAIGSGNFYLLGIAEAHHVLQEQGAACLSVMLSLDGNGTLSCTSLAPGVYYLSMLINDQVIKRKFVKL